MQVVKIKDLRKIIEGINEDCYMAVAEKQEDIEQLKISGQLGDKTIILLSIGSKGGSI